MTLTAVPAQGFVFGGWSGACSGTSASATVTLSGDASCTATFTALYTLQVTKNGPGTVTSAPAGISCGDTCSATYTAGTVVTLTATPASGYVFVGWSGTGCTTGTVPMSQATTCTATFGHRLTVAARLKSGSPYTDVQWTSSPADAAFGQLCGRSRLEGLLWPMRQGSLAMDRRLSEPGAVVVVISGVRKASSPVQQTRDARES